jgi:hypothetical protein
LPAGLDRGGRRQFQMGNRFQHGTYLRLTELA